MKRVLILAVLALAAAGCGLRGEVDRRRFELQWTVTVEIPEGADSTVIWIAVPQERPEQKVSDLRVMTDQTWAWVSDSDFGNRLVRVTVSDQRGLVPVRMTAQVERFPVAAPVPQSLSHRQTALYLREEPKVHLGPEITARSDSLGADHRRRYDYVLETCREGMQARGGRETPVDVWKGRGADPHLLFLALCRAAGVPAVFETGVPTWPEGEIGRRGGDHGWAWFYRDGAWVPVDISEAILNSDRAEYYFGHLDPDRITFSRGRAIRLPGMAGPPVDDLSAGVYAEADGIPFAGMSRTITYRPQRR